ncbi:hypothetical protein GN244_ATG08746 [Phytophthora infestans]|uniref:Uncharacterized protein n=1 Tax=Phytophthora infestans TaxID=4787 RepID=A0A833SWI9_PHYIN|nr:hypothetical protein GN244_ATG08746 [Phytophthora infestans]KAF4144800.1 hypothetical protein GN958_ATG05968 [Phytophthora infestans]
MVAPAGKVPSRKMTAREKPKVEVSRRREWRRRRSDEVPEPHLPLDKSGAREGKDAGPNRTECTRDVLGKIQGIYGLTKGEETRKTNEPAKGKASANQKTLSKTKTVAKGKAPAQSSTSGDSVVSVVRATIAGAVTSLQLREILGTSDEDEDDDQDDPTSTPTSKIGKCRESTSALTLIASMVLLLTTAAGPPTSEPTPTAEVTGPPTSDPTSNASLTLPPTSEPTLKKVATPNRSPAMRNLPGSAGK